MSGLFASIRERVVASKVAEGFCQLFINTIQLATLPLCGRCAKAEYLRVSRHSVETLAGWCFYRMPGTEGRICLPQCTLQNVSLLTMCKAGFVVRISEQAQ